MPNRHSKRHLLAQAEESAKKEERPSSALRFRAEKKPDQSEFKETASPARANKPQKRVVIMDHDVTNTRTGQEMPVRTGSPSENVWLADEHKADQRPAASHTESTRMQTNDSISQNEFAKLMDSLQNLNSKFDSF